MIYINIHSKKCSVGVYLLCMNIH